jgi:NADH dehydrogenase FAD-containing subunit
MTTNTCACPRTRTVAILGAAYGGAHAAQKLAASVPEDWRVVVIDRQSHMNRECG